MIVAEPVRRLILVAMFAMAFAFVEASVVVYLRALYYPAGFMLPLKPIGAEHLGVELVREAATIAMLAAVALLAGILAWQRFGYFLVAFGVWDLGFYFWLKVVLGWPASLADWDVLFLLPLPWIGPVLAPVLIAVLMTVLGCLMVMRTAAGRPFRPSRISWGLALTGTAVLLYSFMSDVSATLHGAMPLPYRYELLAAGLLLYAAAYGAAVRPESLPGRHAGH